jgi:hypothetical protein
MLKKTGFKILVICCILQISLILGSTSYGKLSEPAGCPQFSEGFGHLTGPALIGTVTITSSDGSDTFCPTGSAVYSFVGRCKANSTTLINGCDPEVGFTTISEESLKGYVISAENVPDSCGTGCVIVNTVLSFDDSTAGIIVAEVILMFLAE